MKRPAYAHSKKITLASALVAITICVTIITIGTTSFWSYNEQRSQEEQHLLTEARLLDKAVFASWSFVGNQQERINTDADGSYNFKGIYCSLVGKSVAKLFTLSTDSDYEVRYVRENPRSMVDMPDSFEGEALQSITEGESDEYYGIQALEDNTNQFRYVRAIRLTSDCLDCHGKPAGELDITGHEKEGFDVDDIGGAVSIIMPMEARDADIMINTVRNIMFSVMLAAAIVIIFVLFIHRFVLSPLNKLKVVTTEIGEGHLGADLNDIRATKEIYELIQGIEYMSRQLSDLYENLEERIEDKTRQYQEAIELLSKQKEKIEEVNTLLSEANKRLFKENEYRSNFLSIVSHELRTPLMAIMSFTELWEDASDNSRVTNREYAKKIRTYSLSLLHMIDNTLDIAHIDAGEAGLASEDIDFVDLVEEVEFVCAPLAETKGVELLMVVDPAVPLIRSDWDRLKKIFLNLVSNAIKFSEEGDAVKVHVFLGKEGNRIGIKVKDEGIGIAKENLESIFDRFRQVDSSISRRYGGSGIGLALVKEIVMMLDGEIEVKSTLGKGSEFLIWIPFEEDERYEV